MSYVTLNNSYYVQPTTWTTTGTTTSTSLYFNQPVARPSEPHVETELEWLNRRVDEITDLIAA